MILKEINSGDPFVTNFLVKISIEDIENFSNVQSLSVRQEKILLSLV